jgi:hypothetical protein
MSKKTKKKKNIRRVNANYLLNFKLPMVDFSEKWSPAFNVLELQIGTQPLLLVMKYIDYDEWRDTRYCFGFQCPERLFNFSHKYYCNECFYKLKKDGFAFCKQCGVMKDECFHCDICKQLACICRFCKRCGEHEKECDCFYDDCFYY